MAYVYIKDGVIVNQAANIAQAVRKTYGPKASPINGEPDQWEEWTLVKTPDIPNSKALTNTIELVDGVPYYVLRDFTQEETDVQNPDIIELKALTDEIPDALEEVIDVLDVSQKAKLSKELRDKVARKKVLKGNG